MPTPEELIRTFERRVEKDATWRALWQELFDFTVPRKNEVTRRGTAGQKRTSHLYDSVAPDSVQVLAAAIHGAVTSPTSLWTTFDFENEELRDDEEAVEWLQRGNEKMYRRVQNSNFDSEIQEVYTEVVSAGTGAIFTDATLVAKSKWNPTGFGGFRYESLPIGTYVIAENEFGLVDTLQSQVQMSVRAAIDKFGVHAVPQTYHTWFKKDQDRPVELLHSVFPRLGGRSAVGTAAKRLPWASHWVDMKEKHLLRESGFHEFPYAVVRWTKSAREMWGRGPAEIALPDIRTLNEGVKLRLQGWAIAVRPPMEAKHRGIVGKISTQPSAVNYSREMGNLKPIDFGAKFDVANFNEQQLRERIQAIFFIDKLQLPNKSIITATEAMQRVRAMHRILGPTLGRLDYELLRKIVQRQFNLMLRAGEFDPIPQSVLDAAENDSANIEIEFDGPLARAQRVQDLESMSEFVNAVVPLREVSPEALDNVDFDKYVREAAKATTMTKLLRATPTVDKMRTARAEANAAAVESQNVREDAAALGQAAPALQAAADAQAQNPPLEPGI